MARKNLLFLFLFFSVAIAQCFEKLPPSYQISYGNPDAPVQVVEYFSFTCPKCLKLIREDFEVLKEKYINTGMSYWVFHPDPADRLTLQAMICLEKLDDIQKRLFFEVVCKNLDAKRLDSGCAVMQAAMEYFKHPLPELGKTSFLEGTQEFQTAFAFLKQDDVITAVPTVEINGKIYDEFPSRRFLEGRLTALVAKERPSCK